MAGKNTQILSTDFNELQSKIAQILGIGSGSYGYGQVVSSTPALPKTAITASHWNNLRTDLLKARQHQTGVSEATNLPAITAGITVSEDRFNNFNDFLSLTEEDRLVTPPSGEATRENLVVATRITPWNNTLTHTTTIDFSTPDAMRAFFNTGSAIEISASRSGGLNNIKNTTWSTLLSNMKTIKFARSGTTSTGSGSGSAIGYINLTETNQLVFQKTAGHYGYYSVNEYNVYARLGTTDSEIVLVIEFADIVDEAGNDNVSGTLTSTIQVYRASGQNVSVRRPAATSQFVGGSIVVTPVDPTPTVTYALNSNTSIIGEGSTGVTFTVITTDVSNGTVLYWTTNSGTASTADFVDGVLTGIVTINDNTGSFIRIATSDSITEGLDSFYMELRTTSISGPVVANSNIITVQDLSTSPVPTPATYEIDQTASIISEGSISATFTVTTTNVANGTTLYWTTNANIDITTSDFVDNSLSGSFVINNNSGSFSRTAKSDFISEGAEFFNVEIRTGSITGPIVVISAGVGIVDSSQTQTFALTVLPTVVNEGAIVTLTLNNSNVPENTQLYLTNSGTFSNQDILFLSGPTIEPDSKEFTVSSTPVEWSIQVLADQVTEVTEAGAWQVRSGSKTGDILATSSLVTINDTSKTPAPVYSIIASNNIVNEGQIVTFTVTALGADGIHYWSQIGTATSADFDDGNMAGSFLMSGGIGIIQRLIKADRITEGSENIIIQVRKDIAIVATSSPITISDTSQIPTYSLVSSASVVSENSSIFTFTFNTTNADGTYYWNNVGTTTGSDFTDNANNGVFTVINGTGTFQRAAKADLTTDPSETVIMEIRKEVGGTVLVTSNAVTITDTSLTPIGGVSYGPGQHVFTVPANVSSIQVNAVGAGGGSGGADAYSGGPGSISTRITGTMSVVPGTILMIYVGSPGSNGISYKGSAAGGAGGSSYGIGYDGGRGGTAGWAGSSGGGGGGGGASVLVYNGTIRVVAAGGGGGGGGGMHSAGAPGISEPTGGAGYNGTGSFGRNCSWAEGGGGGGGGGGKPAGVGATADPSGYDFGGRGGHRGGSWIDASIVGNLAIQDGVARGTVGNVTLAWGA